MVLLFESYLKLLDTFKLVQTSPQVNLGTNGHNIWFGEAITRLPRALDKMRKISFNQRQLLYFLTKSFV